MKILFTSITVLFLTVFSTQIFSQNVAINTSGAVANTSAMLDISSTNSGLLIPRVALTATNAAGPITTPATSLMVYNTATASAGNTAVSPGYYYWDGTQWVRFVTGALPGPAWMVTGNAGTNPATHYAGTSDAVDFVIRTSATERLRVLAGGNIGIGTTVPTSTLHVISGATSTIQANNSNANNDGIWAFNTAGAGAGGGAGLFAASNQSAIGSAGVWSQSGNTSGTAVVGAGNNGGASVLIAGSGGAFTGTGTGLYSLATTAGSGTGVLAAGNNLGAFNLVAGSGGAFTGLTTGVYARFTTGGTGQGIICQDNFAAQVSVLQYSGVYYKIIGTGTVSCVVPDLQNNEVVMHCPETPEFYYQDYGQGQLVNGRAHIDLDPVFAKNVAITEEHPLRVFIQLEDNEFCLGVVVKNKTTSGFDVVELGGGTSNTPFQWTVTCNAGDQDYGNGRIAKYSELRFEKAPDKLENTQVETQTTIKKVPVE